MKRTQDLLECFFGGRSSATPIQGAPSPFLRRARGARPSIAHRPSSTGSLSSLQPSAFSPQPSKSGGFTLLELMVVVTMMIFITTIAALNYFGAVRSAGYAAVSKDVFNALLMARQRACIDNKAVYFYLLDSTNYVVLESFGALDQIFTSDPSPGALPNSQLFLDQYVDSSAFSSNMALLDIDSPGTGAIVWKADNETSFPQPRYIDANGNTLSNTASFCALHVTNDPSCTSASFSLWTQGHRYGTPVFARQMLPKGFAFVPDPLSQPNNQVMVLFQPDGTVDTANNLSQFVVQETLKTDSVHKVTFVIKPNGQVKENDGG